jgi:5-methyltetrahydropteroyltriglutamate--homocysteine methyltransferase
MIRTTVVGKQPLDKIVPYGRGIKAELDRRTSLRTDDSEYRWEIVVKEIRSCIRVQLNLGIDLLTEGEVARSDYWSPFVLDTEGTVLSDLGGGRVAVVSRLRANPLNTIREWRAAEDAAARPVKITIPGPMTCATYTTDNFYGSFRELCNAWASVINDTALNLVSAGCRNIQIDDCQVTYQLDKAIDFGLEDIGAALKDLGDDVTTVLHMCRGTPGFIETYGGHGKAPCKDCYQPLVPQLDQIKSTLRVVSVEQAFCPSDPGIYRSMKKSDLMLGVINVNSLHVESVDEVISRVKPFLEFVDPERLLLAPDCGFSSWLYNGVDNHMYTTAMKKLENMVEAARCLNA